MMETIEYRTVDKSDWADGPWKNEPDKRQWQDPETGLPCLIVRGPVGALCGYVGVSDGHPWHRVAYSHYTTRDDGKIPAKEESPESKLDVHGGVTFSSHCSSATEEDYASDAGACGRAGEGEEAGGSAPPRPPHDRGNYRHVLMDCRRSSVG